MTRPGLIVGLGGTGQWVLTWLKRDLLLSNNGVMPKNVRLLEIDTCTQLEAKASRINAKGQKEEATEVGGVMLDRSEYVYIGGNAHELARQIKARQAKGKEVVYPWFHAAKWLSTQAPRTFVLDEGAGRLRQFGRLAVFKDMQGEEAGSSVWSALRTAIEGVRVAVNEQRSLEIIVVGSFAGGTGSGLFIDIALILRLLARQLGVNHILRGMFALPSVFTTNPDAEMKARSFAAWRELNRFMVVDEDFPMPEIRYVPTNPNFRIQPDQRLFDACYLVDGKRKGQPIAKEAKYGVFPMLAEFLSAILDEQAGTAYTQWIFTNLAPEYAKKPETPMYSAVGAYTVQVPAYFVQELSGYQYGQQILLKLLSPKHEPELGDVEKERLVDIGAERHLALAAPDRNQEDRGFPGRARSLMALSGSAMYQGLVAKPTVFQGRVAQIVRDAVEHNKRQGIVDMLARGGTGAASWAAYFPDLGDDPQFEKVRRDVNEQMAYNIVQQYRRREGEREEEARAKFKKIPEDLRTRFGGVTASGEEVEEYHGTCGDVLKECERVQLVLFRQLLQLHLLDILNGHSDDALIARSGKLGYAWDYFDGLVIELEHFLQLMADVKKRREELKPELKLVGLSKKAQDFLNATAGKKIPIIGYIFNIESGKVQRAELEYLNAQQRLMEIRREDILHYYVVETVQEMKATCEQVRDALQRWIWHLATGDNAYQLPGLWDKLREGKQQLKNAHLFDAASHKVQQLVADELMPVGEGDIRQALSLWRWRPAFEGERFVLQAQILPQVEEEVVRELPDPTLGASSELRWQMGEQNAEALLSLARRRFGGVAARTTVAAEIKREYPDPKKFAEEIADVSAEPLFEGTGPGCVKKSNLIRVMTDENDPYFIGPEGLEGHLRAIHHLDRAIRDDTYGIQVVGSEHPYKLTLVRTDDLYDFDAYRAWEECLESYQTHIGGEDNELNPTLMHNFTAEIEAVKIEQKIVRQLKIDYRSLHPRVVMLLEDRTALEQFIQLFMLGVISETPSSVSPYRWQLSWRPNTEEEVIWLSKGMAEKPEEPTLLQAMHGYVVRKTSLQPGHTSRRIDIEFARILIEQKLKELGRSGYRRLLNEHLTGPRGLVTQLRQVGYIHAFGVQAGVSRQDYVDMALVVELFLKEQLGKLDREEERERDESKRIEQYLHRRVEALMGEDGKYLQQFAYLAMLGMIKDVAEAPKVYRWQLTIPGKREEQVFWLTEPWSRSATQNTPPPALLDALEGYVLVKRTHEPGRGEVIDHDYIQQVLDAQMEEKGSQGEIALLKRHLGENGFVAFVRGLGVDPRRPEVVRQQEYVDLANVIGKMLRERLDDLEKEWPEPIFGNWGEEAASNPLEEKGDEALPPSTMNFADA